MGTSITPCNFMLDKRYNPIISMKNVFYKVLSLCLPGAYRVRTLVSDLYRHTNKNDSTRIVSTEPSTQSVKVAVGNVYSAPVKYDPNLYRAQNSKTFLEARPNLAVCVPFGVSMYCQWMI